VVLELPADKRPPEEVLDSVKHSSNRLYNSYVFSVIQAEIAEEQLDPELLAINNLTGRKTFINDEGVETKLTGELLHSPFPND